MSMFRASELTATKASVPTHADMAMLNIASCTMSLTSTSPPYAAIADPTAMALTKPKIAKAAYVASHAERVLTAAPSAIRWKTNMAAIASVTTSAPLKESFTGLRWRRWRTNTTMEPTNRATRTAGMLA